MEEYTFKRIDASQLEQIRLLHHRCFNSYLSPTFIEKKYDTSRFGVRDIGYFAYDQNNQPAAFYGAFPVLFQIDGTPVLAAQSGDTMTDPNHRKKGLFTRLAKKTYELAEQEGVKFIFGFPNKNSYPGFIRKLNWEFHDFLYNFSFRCVTIPMAGIVKKVRFLDKIYKKYLNYQFSRHQYKGSTDAFFTSKDSAEDGILKNRDFVDYKEYGEGQLLSYKGFLIWVKVDGMMMVGDVGLFPANETKKFLKTVKKLAVRLGCQKVVITVNKNHWLYQRLEEALPPEESLPIGFLGFNTNLPFEKLTFSRVDLDTF